MSPPAETAAAAHWAPSDSGFGTAAALGSSAITQTSHWQSALILVGSYKLVGQHFGLSRPNSVFKQLRVTVYTDECWDPEPAGSVRSESCMDVAGESPSTSCGLTEIS